MNVNGGRTCRWVPATGYNDKGGGDLLISGIRSVAIKWRGWDYNPDDITAAPDHKTFKAYKPVGMISQLPALKLDYKGKNLAGGRKALGGYISAAHRHMRHGKSIRIHLVIGEQQVRLTI